MKKLCIVLAIVLIGCLLASCSVKKNGPDLEIVLDTDEFLKKIGEADIFLDTMGSTRDTVLSEVMYLSTDKIEKASLFMGTAFTGEAYGIFKCKSDEDAAVIVEELKTFVENQKDIYISYAPDAIPHFNNAIIKQKGPYVVYVVADKNVEANRIIEEFLR